MIIVITSKERNARTGRDEEVVSHGIDATTGKTVIMSCDPIERIGARFDPELREYVLDVAPGC